MSTFGCRRLRFFEPVVPFRSEYLYTNNMYVLAGAVAETLEEDTWENLIMRYIYEPLEMASSSFVDVLDWDNSQAAVPYTSSNGYREEAPRELFV